MGYPRDLLSSRAAVRPGLYAVIPKDGLVNNVIPGIEGCRVSIVASPKIGAGFVQYVIDAAAGGKTTCIFGNGHQTECFIYCIEGSCEVKAGQEAFEITDGGYVYSPAGTGLEFENQGGKNARLLLYKQIYVPFNGVRSRIYAGNVNGMEYRIYDNMENVYIKDLLPAETGFDMNMHILAFEPGGCHPYVETHVQEHGMYILGGEGMYLIDDRWMGIKKDDFIWLGAFCPQAAYGTGRELFTYIYSKDCNRDAEL